MKDFTHVHTFSVAFILFDSTSTTPNRCDEILRPSIPVPVLIFGPCFILNYQLSVARMEIMDTLQNVSEVVNLIVGGSYYSLDPLDLERFPDCYFSHLLKDEWNRDRSAVIRIDRDGRLFRFVSSYIHVGV